MNIELQQYARNLRQTPPVKCDFKVGELVTFTNQFGVAFPDMRVIGFADDDLFYGRFIHLAGPKHPEAFWFPHAPDELTKQQPRVASVPDVPDHGIDNYEDACDATLSRARAIKEIQSHDCDVSEFLREVGDKPAYTGKEVLDWLGY